MERSEHKFVPNGVSLQEIISGSRKVILQGITTFGAQ